MKYQKKKKKMKTKMKMSCPLHDFSNSQTPILNFHETI